MYNTYFDRENKKLKKQLKTHPEKLKKYQEKLLEYNNKLKEYNVLLKKQARKKALLQKELIELELEKL